MDFKSIIKSFNPNTTLTNIEENPDVVDRQRGTYDKKFAETNIGILPNPVPFHLFL